MVYDRQVCFARKLETMWFRMVSLADRDYEGLGDVVDAIFANNPEEALIRCRENHVSENITREIREVFGITS
jgi:hypothetical protein